MTNAELIQLAASVLNPVERRGGLVGDVGCALISKAGKAYTGVCADVGSNTFCAEQNAIGSMITDGEFVLRTIVAVWRDAQGSLFVVAPCGNCRQFMLDIDERNLNAEIIIDVNKTLSLQELIPFHDSWERQDG